MIDHLHAKKIGLVHNVSSPYTDFLSKQFLETVQQRNSTLAQPIVWQIEALRRSMRLKTVSSPDDLALDQLEKDTPIFIDKNLGSISGIQVASELHEQGFTKLSLATGEVIDASTLPKFIQSVVGKEFPASAIRTG